MQFIGQTGLITDKDQQVQQLASDAAKLFFKFVLVVSNTHFVKMDVVKELYSALLPRYVLAGVLHLPGLVLQHVRGRSKEDPE